MTAPPPTQRRLLRAGAVLNVGGTGLAFGRRARSPLAREIFDVDSATHVQLLVVEQNVDAQSHLHPAGRWGVGVRASASSRASSRIVAFATRDSLMPPPRYACEHGCDRIMRGGARAA